MCRSFIVWFERRIPRIQHQRRRQTGLSNCDGDPSRHPAGNVGGGETLGVDGTEVAMTDLLNNQDDLKVIRSESTVSCSNDEKEGIHVSLRRLIT